jgi:hypothetical protein
VRVEREERGDVGRVDDQFVSVCVHNVILPHFAPDVHP